MKFNEMIASSIRFLDWKGVYLLFKSDKNIHNVKDGKKELTKLVVDD